MQTTEPIIMNGGNSSRVSLAASSTYSQHKSGFGKESGTGSTLTANSSSSGAGEGLAEKEKGLLEAVATNSSSPECEQLDEKNDVDTPSNIETASTDLSLSVQCESSLVTWSGEDDPENSKNIKAHVKFVVGLNIGLMNFIVSFAISVFSGVAPEAGYELGYDKDTMQLGVSAFILGLALGQHVF